MPDFHILWDIFTFNLYMKSSHLDNAGEWVAAGSFFGGGTLKGSFMDQRNEDGFEDMVWQQANRKNDLCGVGFLKFNEICEVYWKFIWLKRWGLSD